MPDDALMQALEAWRAKGRDDYPVQAMWNAVIAGVVFQHPSIASLRREFGRNPALMDLCGFEMLPVAKKPTVGAHVIPLEPYLGAPPDSAFSRFLATLIQLEAAGGYMKQMLSSLRQSLCEVLPDFGRHLWAKTTVAPSLTRQFAMAYLTKPKHTPTRNPPIL